MDEPSSGAANAPDLDPTVLPPLGELLEALTEQLAGWMPAQRWYAHKGAGAPTVQVDGWAPLRIATDHLVLDTVLAVHLDGGGSARYQVPLVLRRPDPAAGRRDRGTEIGVLAVPGGPVRVDDAMGDPAGRAAIMAMLARGDGTVGPRLRLVGRPPSAAAALPVGPSARTRLLSGEQSNTSMIVEADEAAPVIVKLFRLIQHGPNPDVVLGQALTHAGSEQVPATAGCVHLAIGGIRTHALFAQDFLPGVEDAWRTALDQARGGTDFSPAAESLGAAVAQVHRDLATALGTVPTDADLAAAMVTQMRERLDQVAALVPAVAEHLLALEGLLAAAADPTGWPPMQRIHGDLHLGQVLAVPERGWVLLDFEGEPLRPLEQRSRPDSPLRDVAGMLRSLDYVAGAVAQADAVDATAWAQRAREAFLRGYLRERGLAPDGAADPALEVLLAAFEADKAVYEALYEASNRPQWLPIPLGALERISAAAGAAGSAG